MKRKIFIIVNLMLSSLVFLVLLYFFILGQECEYPRVGCYEACDIQTTTTEDIDLSYEIFRHRTDGNITRNVELIIPANISVHICGVFSDGTVEIDDIDMDIELDQEILELLEHHQTRMLGWSGISKENNSLYGSDLFWGKISVNQLDSDELVQMYKKLAFKPDHIDDFWNISTIASIVLFAASSIFITRKKRIPLAIKIIFPWIMGLIIIVLQNFAFDMIFM